MTDGVTIVPTRLIEGPYRFWWYSADRMEPPHVHVERDGRTAKFSLDPLAMARSNGMAKRDLTAVMRIIAGHREDWLQRWHRELGR